MGNDTILLQFKDLGIETENIDPERDDFWILLTSLVLFVLWVTFLTLYFSRLVALFVSFALNHLLRLTKNPGHVKVGSFSVSLLGGKVMFKDLVYGNDDFSICINDAWIIFSFWRPIPSREINYNDQSSRLHISLNGFQVHWYNCIDKYKEIAQQFGLERLFPGAEFKRTQPQTTEPPPGWWDRWWALVGIIRLDIWSGRTVVGNRLLPYMFVLSWENMQSKIKLCESTNDRALLSYEGQMESIRGSFEKHPDYDGEPYREPPRTMGDGFALVQSANLNFFYRQDLVGYETMDEQKRDKNSRPIWESIFRFGPNTVMSYGPWAEQQRVLIWKFFFPADYKTQAVTEMSKKGHRRKQIMHDVRISLLKESSIDLWFMNGDQLESIHTRCQAGSTIDMSIWWIMNEEGFNSTCNVSLLNVVSTTSLLYRKLFECETLRVDGIFQYPRFFNAKQVWKFKYNITKATMWFVWDHKRFFTDLINEWLGEAPADMLEFIPFEVHTDLSVSDGFEFIMLLNSGNWVDPSEMQSENVECAIVGQKLTFTTIMSFVDFLPETHLMKYTIMGRNALAMRMKHPMNSATAPLLAMLTRAAHHTPNAPKSNYGTYSNYESWHECWRTESIDMIFDYKMHPSVVNQGAKSTIPFQISHGWLPTKVDHPMLLAPDKLDVFIDLEGSEMQMTGLLIRFILDLKNNYFGFYDSMTDIHQAEKMFDPNERIQGMFNKIPINAPVENYRPMDVDVELRVHNIRGHCLLHSMGGAEPEPCPVLYTEELVMELKKTSDEMILQVAVGQCGVHFERASIFQPDGFLSLSGLQFRGQALLSSVDVPWDMAIIEYAWQMEILVGELTGSLEVPSHFFALYQFIETLLLFALAKDDETIIPTRFSACQHGNLVASCPKKAEKAKQCEGEERLKYRQIRVCVDSIKLALCEEKSILDLEVAHVRTTVCNGHEGRFAEHLCVRIPNISVRQLFKEAGESQEWLEVAKVAINGVNLDVELPLPEDGEHLEKARLEFVRKHDVATKRLYFLYSESGAWSCACYGETRFFGVKDTLGEGFLSEINKDVKLYVPKINATGQIGVHQSMFKPGQTILRHEQHFVYPTVRKVSSETSLAASPTDDTPSFHSAFSQQKETRPSLIRPLMMAYSSYLSKVKVVKPVSESPELKRPGALSTWAQGKVVHVDVIQDGMNALQIHAPTLHPIISSEAIGIGGKKSGDVPWDCLAIRGSVAENFSIFVTPLAIEVFERLTNSVSSCMHKLNSAFLIQHTYLGCVLKDHRQPLTESLFHSTSRKIQWEVSLDLPKIHASLFQCGSMDPSNPLPESVSSNICLIMIDKATIATTKSIEQVGGVNLSMNCRVVTSQLLHLVDKADAEFLAARTPFRSKVNWDHSDVGRRHAQKDLRVIMDLHIPDLMMSYEDSRPLTIQEKGVSNEGIITKENRIKVTIGTVRNFVVMARPLEKTAKHEFPLYYALSPAITAWLNVAQRLDAKMDCLVNSMDQWNDMSFARMMKLALDCPEDSILGAKGKNMMDAVKLLGKHQASCPTCLLLKVLMRWYALPETALQLHQPMVLKRRFDDDKLRKTALMALLSHWHPDICQMVKLASHTEAGRFRADPGEKKETRINMEAMESRHRRNGSAASRNLPKEAQSQQHRDSHPKLDLYSYIRSAHRELNERRDGKKKESTLPKDYVNPMDIIPQAFFYSFYRSRRLNWTLLDGLLNQLNKLKASYELTINEIAVDLVEPKLLSSPASADSNQKLLAPCVHHLVSVCDIGVKGGLTWNIEMDEKNLMPVRGKGHLTYEGAIKNVQFVLAIASVSLVKEVILVAKSAADTLAELKKNSPSNPMTPLSVDSTQSDEDIEPRLQSWDEKVFDMTKDFEKNAQRAGVMSRGDILKAVHGKLKLEDVCLESRLTDLYVSFDMKSIDVMQEHNPVPVGRNTAVPHETDKLNVMLRKAKLNIRQSLSGGSSKSNESKPILLCVLKETTAILNHKHLVMNGLPPTNDTSLSIDLGAIEGELPMSAGSLHEVVMKHGPQLEIEFDRLSAQPHGLTWDQGAGGALTIDVSSPVDTSAWNRGVPLQMKGRMKPESPIVRLQFKIKLESIELSARILPSLLAKYRMGRATAHGETGGKANWNVQLMNHHVEFHVEKETVNHVEKESFKLQLPSIDVNGQYLAEEPEYLVKELPKPVQPEKLLHRKGGYLKMEVALGHVSYNFSTELLNHVLFVGQSFRTEIQSLVSRIQSKDKNATETPPLISQSAPAIPTGTRNEQLHAPPPHHSSSSDRRHLLFQLIIKGVTKAAAKEPWLQLTAATPTATAIRFTFDELQMELTNLVVVVDEHTSREKFVGRGLIQFSAKLGQLVKASSYEEEASELQEYATFMTMIRVSNEESSQQTHKYHISLNRPYMMIKSSAVDKAILLWLNYKNTYDYWRAERTKYEKSLTERQKRNSISQAMFSPQLTASQDFDINLSLSIVGGMYVCMPLVSYDITDGMPALVLSLQKSEVSVSIKKELACQAQFTGFKLNFINNFDEQSLMNFQESTAGEVMSNFFFFPQGSYKLCSKASNDLGDAKWVLSIRSHMRGMVIDLDQRIGKLAKMLINTISSLGEEDHYHDFYDHAHHTDEDEALIDGAHELGELSLMEQRIRWMEQKMHETLRELSELTIKKANEVTLEAARKKLRQYELLRFKEFRKTMVDKLKRSNDKAGSRRQSTLSLLHPPLVTKSSNPRTSSDDGGETKRDIVNMHIDVQVNIESGACTLRTSQREQQTALAKRPSTQNLRAAKHVLAPQVTFTKFSIPSVDLKGYYQSSGAAMSVQQASSSSSSSSRSDRIIMAKNPNRGCFYLSLGLASMPSETVVTPHLADFLEQVLEPLPISTGARSDISVNTLDDGTETMNNIVAIDTSALPLDFIFHLSVQSSVIRFDGQQQRSSAADCMLKLPSLTLMGSTRRNDGAEYPGGIDISATLSAFSLSIYSPHQQQTAHDALSLTLDHLSLVISRSKNSSNEADNRVRFVLTSNIGTANFNYDMRRLSELLAFPKPWFRKTIARRVFFGDQTGTLKTPDASKHSTIASTNYHSNRSAPDVHEKPWSATVFLAVQWKELNVNAQMSNTMGTTSWITRKGLLRSLAKLDSHHQRDITLTFKLDGSELTAHGGAISGEVTLSALSLQLNHTRAEKQVPRNKAQIQLGSFATRVEWMSRAVLIGQCEKPSIQLSDDYPETMNAKGETNRVGVLLNIKGSWEDLQVVITKATFDDFQRIVQKLKSFFTEQLKHSKKAWSFDDETSVTKMTADEHEEEEEDSPKIKHWEKVLDLVTEIQYQLKLLPYPAGGETVVGGSVEFEAGRISVACMNGEMTSSSWALFNLRSPSILFSPEAQLYYVNKDSGTVGVTCRQRLIIRIGDATGKIDPRHYETTVANMGNVCQVQQAKGHAMRQNASIAASLDYLIGDVLKESKLAPLTTPTGPDTVKRANHELTVLFHFPSLEAALTSVQKMECDADEGAADPVVHSSFTADFYGAVHLNTDFNKQVQFLPKLIQQYTKAGQGSSTSGSAEEVEEKKDNRIYQCETWHFSPSINFMEKGQAWKPPLVDDILKKLNVYDHRRTIPKVLQRAMLDTLDMATANGLLQILKLVDRNEENKM